MNKSLEHIKVGDPVVISSMYRNYMATVTKVTKMFVIANHTKFRKDGTMVNGDRYNITTARPATDEDYDAIKQQAEKTHIINALRQMDLYSLSYSKLKRIYNIILE